MSNDIPSTIRIGLIIATIQLPAGVAEVIETEFERDPGGILTQFYNDATVDIMAELLSRLSRVNHDKIGQQTDEEIAAAFRSEVNRYLTDHGQIAYHFINDVRVNYAKYRRELIDLGFDVR